MQKLNKLNADINEQNNTIESDKDFEDDTVNVTQNLDLVQPNKKSKWDDYIDKTEHNKVEFVEEDNAFDDKKVVLEIPKKLKMSVGIDYFKNKKTILNTSADSCDNHSINAENIQNLATLRADKDQDILEKNCFNKKSFIMFIPPKISINSEHAQYNEGIKGKDEEIINDNLCNTFNIKDMELQNLSNEYKVTHTSIPAMPNNNIYSKWDKFTENDKLCESNSESSLIKNTSKYKMNTNNSTFTCFNKNFELDKNIYLANMLNDNKKITVTSLFDDGDLDVLDI